MLVIGDPGTEPDLGLGIPCHSDSLVRGEGIKRLKS